MASKIQFKRGTTTQSDAYRGAEGEVIINTTKDTIVVHDGVEAGGYEIIRSDLSNISGNVPAVNITNVDCGTWVNVNDNYSLYSNSFATGSTASAASTGAGSYTDSNGIWTPTLSTFTSNVAWNPGGYMEIDSRTNAAARFYLDIPSAYLNNYRYVSWISTIYVVSRDNFGTAIGIQDDRADQYDNVLSWFRVDRSVVGGQSGGHMQYANPTEASSSWDDSGGFNWYDNQLQVQYWFDTSNNTGKLIIAGYDCVDVGVGDATRTPPFVGNGAFWFGNWRDGGPNDNGIIMRVYGTEIAAWNGEFSERPTVLYPV